MCWLDTTNLDKVDIPCGLSARPLDARMLINTPESVEDTGRLRVIDTQLECVNLEWVYCIKDIIEDTILGRPSFECIQANWIGNLARRPNIPMAMKP